MSYPYRLWWRSALHWMRHSFNILWLVVFAGYLGVLTGKAVYNNYQDQKQTAVLQQQLDQLKLQRQQWQELVVYYQSDSYRQQELRRTLLLKMPDEKVYALPESSVSKAAADATLAAEPKTKQTSNGAIWRQWVDYLLHGQDV